MKKGIVLLITLFFITAISLLVLKNLDDTDKFLENENYILNNTQVLLGIKNTQQEISKILVKYKDQIDIALQNEGLPDLIPFNIEDLNIQFSLKKSTKKDINELKKDDSKEMENLFFSNDVFGFDYFKDMYKQKLQDGFTSINTTKQVDDIILTFIKQTQNNQIEKIRDDIGFINNDNIYELNIYSEYLKSSAQAFYLIDKEGKVQYFDISFK